MVSPRAPDSTTTESLLDRYFDFFKHIGTLDVAVAVVVLAISRSEHFGTWVYVSLVLLGSL